MSSFNMFPYSQQPMAQSQQIGTTNKNNESCNLNAAMLQQQHQYLIAAIQQQMGNTNQIGNKQNTPNDLCNLPALNMGQFNNNSNNNSNQQNAFMSSQQQQPQSQQTQQTFTSYQQAVTQALQAQVQARAQAQAAQQMQAVQAQAQAQAQAQYAYMYQKQIEAMKQAYERQYIFENKVYHWAIIKRRECPNIAIDFDTREMYQQNIAANKNNNNNCNNNNNNNNKHAVLSQQAVMKHQANNNNKYHSFYNHTNEMHDQEFEDMSDVHSNASLSYYSRSMLSPRNDDVKTDKIEIEDCCVSDNGGYSDCEQYSFAGELGMMKRRETIPLSPVSSGAYPACQTEVGTKNTCFGVLDDVSLFSNNECNNHYSSNPALYEDNNNNRYSPNYFDLAESSNYNINSNQNNTQNNNNNVNINNNVNVNVNVNVNNNSNAVNNNYNYQQNCSNNNNNNNKSGIPRCNSALSLLSLQSQSISGSPEPVNTPCDDNESYVTTNHNTPVNCNYNHQYCNNNSNNNNNNNHGMLNQQNNSNSSNLTLFSQNSNNSNNSNYSRVSLDSARSCMSMASFSTFNQSNKNNNNNSSNNNNNNNYPCQQYVHAMQQASQPAQSQQQSLNTNNHYHQQQQQQQMIQS